MKKANLCSCLTFLRTVPIFAKIYAFKMIDSFLKINRQNTF